MENGDYVQLEQLDNKQLRQVLELLFLHLNLEVRHWNNENTNDQSHFTLENIT